MPIVSKSELERRRALAHNMSSNPVAARSSSEVRSRRTPAAAEVPVRAGTDAPDPLWPEGSLSAHRDYDEGKYRPPVKDRFQKGASGNPTGRPKKALGLKTVIRNAMSKKVTLRDVTGTRRVAMIEALVHKLTELASKGNLRAIDALLKLYALAVPEVVDAVNAAVADQELTAADEAGLALLRDIILAEQRPELDGEAELC